MEIVYFSKKLLKNNVSLSFFLKVFEAILIILITSSISRILGPKDFGTYNFILSIIVLLDSFKKMGTIGILQNRLSRNKESKTILNDLLIMRLICSFIFILVSSLLLKFYLLPQTFLILFIFQIAQIFRITEIYSYALYIFNKGPDFGKINVINNLKLLILLLIGFQTKISLFSLSILFLGNYILDNFIIIYFLQKNNLRYLISKINFSFLKFKNYLSIGLPLAIGNLFLFSSSKVDIFFIRNFLGDYYAGIYSAPSRLVFQSIQLFAVIPFNMVPLLPKKLNFKNPDSSKKIYKITWFVSITFTFFFLLFSSQIIQIIFGNQYIEANKIAPVLGLTIFFNGIMVTDNVFLNYYGLRNIIFLKSFFSLVSNIILNIILIPKFGVFGASLSTLFSSVVISFSGFLYDGNLKNHYKNLLFPFSIN